MKKGSRPVGRGPFRAGRGQLKFVMALPQRGQRLVWLAQVVPQLEHWLSRLGRTGFTGPQV